MTAPLPGEVPPGTRFIGRNIPLERELAGLAAQAAGFTKPGPDGRPAGDDGGLRAFADRRAWGCGVREDLEPLRETGEELADASSYLIWGIVRIYPAYLAGDPDAAQEYGRHMRALSLVIAAWHALHGR